MNPIAYFSQLARYNVWATARLLDAVAPVGEDEYRRDVGLFFKSIHGTLNHLVVGDQLWLDRFEGLPTSITSLDQELHDDFDELTKKRELTDNRLDRLVASLDDTRLSGTLKFRRLSGDKGELTLPVSIVMMQLFNHQTHHRGQVTTLLMQCGVDVGVTDMPMLPAEFASPVFGL